MKPRTSFSILLVFLLCHGLGLAQQIPSLVAQHGYADMILVNGKIVTMDERRYVPDVPGRIYEAMAVKGKKIMGLGTDEEMRRLAGSQTRIVDLGKKTVIPGIIETHAHSYGTALSAYGPQLGVVVPGIQLEVETQPSAEATANASAYWFYTGKITRRTIDGVTRENPVMIRANLTSIYNARAIEELKKAFPDWEEHTEAENYPGAYRDGYEGIMSRGSLGPEYWWRNEPLETFAEAFRLHGQDIVKWGVTTVTTRIPPPRYVSAYYLLNRQGRMPHRLAWHLEVHRGSLAGLEFTRRFYATVGAQWGTMESGNDMMWNDGMANEIWDSLRSETCFGPDLPAPPEIKERERCPGPGSKPWEAYKAAILNGWRPVDSHGVGPHGARLYIQMLDEAAKEGNLTTEYIRSLRPTLEHCIMIGNPPDVIAGFKKYGFILSVGPRFFGEVEEAIRDYGEKAREFVLPIKTWLNEGITVVGQMDSTRLSENFNLFTNTYQLVTRKAFNRSGFVDDEALRTAKVYLPEEAIDQVTALKLWTTWAAEYILAENNLGTLEPGKYADFVVLDQDYFTIPIDETLKIRVVMTGLNGNIVYSSGD